MVKQYSLFALEEGKDQDNVAFTVSIWILAIMYSFLFLFACARSYKTLNQSNYIRGFFAILCIQIMFNALIFWTLIISTLNDRSQLFLTLVPSILMIVTYYNLYLLLFDQMLNSRVEKSASYRRRIDGNCVIKTLRTLGFIFILLIVALNIIYLINFDLLSLTQENEFMQDFGIVLRATFGTVSLWFNISTFVVYIRQSGTPFKNMQEQKNTRYLAIIFVLWTASFIVKIIIYSVATGNYDDPQQINEMVSAIYVIVINIVTDMVPYFSILELKFIEIFTHSASSIARRKKQTESTETFVGTEAENELFIGGDPIIGTAGREREAGISPTNQNEYTVQRDVHNESSGGESNLHLLLFNEQKIGGGLQGANNASANLINQTRPSWRNSNTGEQQRMLSGGAIDAKVYGSNRESTSTYSHLTQTPAEIGKGFEIVVNFIQIQRRSRIWQLCHT